MIHWSLPLTKEPIFFMGIMHREKLIFWNPSIYVEQPNLTEEARTRKSLSSEKKKHISG